MEANKIPEASAYLLQIPLWNKKKNSLSQVHDILVRLGDPETNQKIIHVAGTNGKGSVCADLTSILLHGGYSVGTFISPHLVNIRERLMINGEMVSVPLFQKTFQTVYEVVGEMIGEGYAPPTFFEYLFYMAMTVFAEKKLDYIILETGLGGRIDTTNGIRNPIAVVITSISLDHIQYLGTTIPQITQEKAGIIKQGTKVIYDDNHLEASEVIVRKIREQQAKGYPVSKLDAYHEIEFAAPYQAMNAALAVAAVKVLQIPGINDEICKQGLQSVEWQGRMELIVDDIWLDGAHNVGGIHAFIEAALQLQEKNPKNIQLLFAAVEDKDYNEMIACLCQELHPRSVIVGQLSSDRGLGNNTLLQEFKRAGCKQVEAYTDVGKALEAALYQKNHEDRLFIVGSLYLIGEIKEALRRKTYARL